MMTPIDIQNHQLKPRMGGYNKQETDDFLHTIQENYEQLYKENGDLKKKITTLSEGLQYYKQMESTLQQTLSMAEKTAKETLERSRTAAEKVGKETRAKADEMLAQAKKNADALVNDAKSKAEAMTNEAEAKALAVTRESEEKANRVTTEAEQNAERVTREAEMRAERLTRDAREEADALSQESRQSARRITHDAEDKANTMVTDAERKAENIRINAQERADRVMSEAKISADRLIAEIRENSRLQLMESNKQIDEASNVLTGLKNAYESYKQQFASLLNKQLGQLEEPAYQVNVSGIDQLMQEQQQLKIKEQEAMQQKLDSIAEGAKELDKPLDDSTPASLRSSFSEPEKSSFSFGDDLSKEDDIMVGGLGAGMDTPSSNEPAPEATSAVASLNIDTPSAFEFNPGQGIQVSAEDAEIAYKPPTDDEIEESPVSAPSSETLSEIDAIAAEALKSVNETMDTSYLGESSMLGTSYDDFVPEHKDPLSSDSSPSGSMDLKSAEEVPPTTDDLPHTVQESYDHDNYVTNETYFGSADNMTYSIPDPSVSSEGAGIQSKPIDTDELVKNAMPNIPMPDFSKLDAAISESNPLSHDIPMPDFSALNALAAEAEATIRGESAPDLSAGEESPSSTVQEEYDAETYVTNETYFGSADNIPYSSTSTENPADSFAAGFSGIDPTAGGAIPSAPGGLYSAPGEDDGFSIPMDDVGSSETPFTFYDAGDK